MCGGVGFSESCLVRVGVTTDKVLIESLLNPRVRGEQGGGKKPRTEKGPALPRALRSRAPVT